MVSSEQTDQWSNKINSSFTNTKDRPPRPPSRKDSSTTRPFLTGPIPPTPDYEYDDRGTCVSSASHGFARVHGSDAKEIQKRGTNGTGVPFAFEVQGTSLFPTHGTDAKPPKNHLNENVKRIRHVMRESRERQAVKAQRQPKPVQALWRSKQYDHIQSRVKVQLDEDTQRSLSRPQSARSNFLHAHEHTGPESVRCQSAASSFRRASISSSVNLGTNRTDNKNSLDFVKLNSAWAKSVPKLRKAMSEEVVEQLRTKQEQQLKEYHEKQKGRIPTYIEKQKEKRAQELHDQLVNAPDPDCPPGHVKMDEEKRLSTLRQIEQTRAELEKKMSHLPIRNDSLTLRRTKEELEQKIIKADEAVKIFSKPKVFVKIEQ